MVDLNLGLIETRDLSTVLTAEPTLLQRKDSIISLQCFNMQALVNDRAKVSFIPIQKMKLHFEKDCAVIDAVSLFLADGIVYKHLIQHLLMARFETTLSSLGVGSLLIKLSAINKHFSRILSSRTYQKKLDVYVKFLQGNLTIQPQL